MLAVAALALSFAALFIPLLFVWMAPPVITALSPFLDRPAGLPEDARATYDPKDGDIRWQYCRDLPSGRAIFGPRALMLEHGRRCEQVVPYTYDPPVSLARPGMWVGRDGSVGFSVPTRFGRGLPGPCALAPSLTYLRRSRSLIAEATRLPAFDAATRAGLAVAERSVAAFTPARLRVGGVSGDTGICILEPFDRHEPSTAPRQSVKRRLRHLSLADARLRFGNDGKQIFRRHLAMFA